MKTHRFAQAVSLGLLTGVASLASAAESAADVGYASPDQTVGQHGCSGPDGCGGKDEKKDEKKGDKKDKK